MSFNWVGQKLLDHDELHVLWQRVSATLLVLEKALLDLLKATAQVGAPDGLRAHESLQDELAAQWADRVVPLVESSHRL